MSLKKLLTTNAQFLNTFHNNINCKSVTANSTEFFESEASQTDASGNFVTTATFVTPNLEAGTYKYEYSFEIRNTTNGAQAFGRVENVTDSNEEYCLTFEQFPAANDWVLSSGFKIKTNTTGVKTVIFQVKQGIGGTADIRRMRLIVSRV